MVRNVATAKNNLGRRVWSREEQSSERDVDVFGWTCLCPETLQRPLVPAHLRATWCESLPFTFPKQS